MAPNLALAAEEKGAEARIIKKLRTWQKQNSSETKTPVMQEGMALGGIVLVIKRFGSQNCQTSLCK